MNNSQQSAAEAHAAYNYNRAAMRCLGVGEESWGLSSHTPDHLQFFPPNLSKNLLLITFSANPTPQKF